MFNEIMYNNMKDFQFSEKKIPLVFYRSSEALKLEIRKITYKLAKNGWQLAQITSRGAYIYLKFKCRASNMEKSS